VKIGLVHGIASEADRLRHALDAPAGPYDVIWVARTAEEAVTLAGTAAPHLVLMDLATVKGDAASATRRLTAGARSAVLIMTTSVQANAAQVFEAMGHGALDVVDVTAGSGWADGMTGLLAKVATIARLIGDGRAPAERHRAAPTAAASARPFLVVIGASAGGPAALADLLGRLPKDFPAAIIIVQHVEARFTAGMAGWLGEKAALPVAVAAEGDRITGGTVLLAGTNDHLILTPIERLRYTPEPQDGVYRPSIDVFFHSVSKHWRGDAAGVLLTGMGRDGAIGLGELRRAGHVTIAQDEATSTVYGMPKAATALGAAVDVLPLERIALRLQKIVACRHQGERKPT